MAKKALIVGINDYAPVGAGGPDLRGCVADARDMANTLHVLGIVPAVPASMRILTNANATRANILSGLKWLITGAKAKDVLVFYYSGHGSQIPDPSSEESVDHMDETICPHDFASAGMITDDVLRQAITGLAAGANLDVILDSCHSGTATRELANFTVRYVDPPLEQSFFRDANPRADLRRLMGRGAAARDAVVVPGLNHVLWAGCRDNQLSGEGPIDGGIRGFFTYCFCKALRATYPNVTRGRLDSIVTPAVKAKNTSQTPQLEGTTASINEKVFT